MEVGKKSQLEKRIVVALTIVFAMAALNTLRGLGYFRSGSSSVVTSPLQEVQEPMRADVMAQPGAPSVKPVTQATYTAENLRDPFQSLFPVPPAVNLSPNAGSGAARATESSVEITPPSLALQGMLWGGPAPSVIIADEVYGLGDTVQGAVIKAIQREGIAIELQGRTFQVAFQPEMATNAKRQGQHERRR